MKKEIAGGLRAHPPIAPNEEIRSLMDPRGVYCHVIRYKVDDDRQAGIVSAVNKRLEFALAPQHLTDFVGGHGERGTKEVLGDDPGYFLGGLADLPDPHEPDRIEAHIG